MAGSNRWFPYTTDSDKGSVVFGLLADESNTEGANEDETELPDPAPIFSIPKNLEPRQVVLKNADGATRICYILTPATYDDISPNQTDLITGFTVVRKKAERITKTIVNIDTGQTDGDIEGDPPPP